METRLVEIVSDKKNGLATAVLVDGVDISKQVAISSLSLNASANEIPTLNVVLYAHGHSVKAEAEMHGSISIAGREYILVEMVPLPGIGFQGMKERAEQAIQIVNTICSESRPPRMSIPNQPADEDNVLMAALEFALACAKTMAHHAKPASV